MIKNGDLSAWTQVGNANWLASSGVVSASQGEGFLVSKLSVSDFQIDFEYWVSGDSNASFFFRATDPNLINSDTAYEINLVTATSSGLSNPSAKLFTEHLDPSKIAGKWNRLQVTALGERLSLKLNNDSYHVFDTRFGKGSLAINFRAGELMLKNISVTIPGRW